MRARRAHIAFTGISVMLFALSVLLFANLAGAVDHLMESRVHRLSQWLAQKKW
ncbi:MAG: hypothetical protein J6E42_05185 [Firmicutes bacterium]|nr:hypothetical protein [Bacillota bacterium]